MIDALSASFVMKPAPLNADRACKDPLSDERRWRSTLRQRAS